MYTIISRQGRTRTYDVSDVADIVSSVQTSMSIKHTAKLNIIEH